jgi:hypothetical protein
MLIGSSESPSKSPQVLQQVPEGATLIEATHPVSLSCSDQKIRHPSVVMTRQRVSWPLTGEFRSEQLPSLTYAMFEGASAGVRPVEGAASKNRPARSVQASAARIDRYTAQATKSGAWTTLQVRMAYAAMAPN